MENKKVIEIIQSGLAFANWTDEQKQAFIIAGESVKKQIPFKVQKNDKETTTRTCKCGVLIEKMNGEFYCKYCGQKLIW